MSKNEGLKPTETKKKINCIPVSIIPRLSNQQKQKKK